MNWLRRILNWWNHAAEPPLFDPRFVYPSDRIGRYQEFEGDVVDARWDDEVTFLTVRTEYGDFEGVVRRRIRTGRPKRACIRVYDIGGGFYPDHLIQEYGDL